jgi:hypothetical protein
MGELEREDENASSESLTSGLKRTRLGAMGDILNMRGTSVSGMVYKCRMGRRLGDVSRRSWGDGHTRNARDAMVTPRLGRNGHTMFGMVTNSHTTLNMVTNAHIMLRLVTDGHTTLGMVIVHSSWADLKTRTSDSSAATRFRSLT